jgi:cyclopropane fatty-acyl-phospholipid synthase-like methyltransferase
VLDAGCGTGDNALFLAERGCKVTGFDYLPEPVERAKRKAAQRGLTATFQVKDATTLSAWPEKFDNAVDCGLFHVFSDDDRKKYVAGVAHVLKSGGRLFLMCFSDAEPAGFGPRRISQQELRDAFTRDWTVESIEPVAFEINPKMKENPFTPGGPKSWFAIIRRN